MTDYQVGDEVVTTGPSYFTHRAAEIGTRATIADTSMSPNMWYLASDAWEDGPYYFIADNFRHATEDEKEEKKEMPVPEHTFKVGDRAIWLKGQVRFRHDGYLFSEQEVTISRVSDRGDQPYRMERAVSSEENGYAGSWWTEGQYLTPITEEATATAPTDVDPEVWIKKSVVWEAAMKAAKAEGLCEKVERELEKIGITSASGFDLGSLPAGSVISWHSQRNYAWIAVKREDGGWDKSATDRGTLRSPQTTEEIKQSYEGALGTNPMRVIYIPGGDYPLERDW